MKQAVWTPITAAGEVDDAELHRPADTAEPTTWEVAIPPFGERQAQVLTAVWGLALGCPQHRFWALAPQFKTLPEEGWPDNVTLAVGPLRTQAEADERVYAAEVELTVTGDDEVSIAADVTTTEGTFRLVADVSDVTVDLLSPE